MQALSARDPRQVGDYQLVARLGGGAMGSVYLGRSRGGRAVAVKVVHAPLADDPQFRERFRREVEIARAIGGFWTAAVVDADPTADLPWLASEYVPGPTVQQAVDLHGGMPERTVWRLAGGLAEALAVIHAAGLVHRDVKPSNVLLAANGPRLIDFGISRALDHGTLTATGAFFGTPGFLSPEQTTGTGIGPASDVFSLGAVLVFAATGTGPYGNGSVVELVGRVTSGRPDLHGVPETLRPLLARCLARDPAARPTPARVLEAVDRSGQAETHDDWLPRPVRTLIAERALATVPVAHDEHVPGRPATRPYTMMDDLRAVSSPAPRPERLAAAQTAEPSRPAPSPNGDRSTFGAGREWAMLWATVFGLVAWWGAGMARGGPGIGAGARLLGAVVCVFFAIRSIRYLTRAVRRGVRLEVDRIGLAVICGRDRNDIGWSTVARVGVTGGKNEPWLMVWFGAGALPVRHLGPREFRGQHGGVRLFRVGDHRTRLDRRREVRALRAALAWYAPDRYDPNL